jgi:hypothetical protein
MNVALKNCFNIIPNRAGRHDISWGAPPRPEIPFPFCRIREISGKDSLSCHDSPRMQSSTRHLYRIGTTIKSQLVPGSVGCYFQLNTS